MEYWNQVKSNFKEKFNFELLDEDKSDYDAIMAKFPKGQVCCIFLPIGVLFFIMIALFNGELPRDMYTYFPLLIVVGILISSANDLVKKTENLNKKVIEVINLKRNQGNQDNLGPSISPISSPHPIQPSNSVPKPIAASICPMCGKAIPLRSEICKHCGQPLLWE